ncbi:MAG: ABC transporter ATP-binding protein [Bacilli bacterium]|nr:ABC transporter ATP-binding protein [Bacilli bacterium]MDD4734123.1 ABC transporter ATP-binding protein [Bacilli bacterium]
MLKINNLTKYYKDVLGVEELDLELKKGEIFGFIGPNGSGKSTTIRCVMNLISKTSGEIYFNDNLLTNKSIDYKNNIGYLPSEINLYDDLTVKQMIEYSNSFYEKDCLKRADYLIKKLDLDTRKKIDELSLGNSKKLGIVLALMHEPQLLILDEASSGLDPLMQEVFYELLLEEKAKGTTIFFSSHVLSEIKKVCDRVGIIKNGRLIKIEDIKEMSKNNFQIITVVSNEIDKISKDILFISKTEDTIKFIYKEDANKLIKMLGKYNISKLTIEEPSIEEIFMHFYK